LREGEEPREALRRELREELGIEVEVGTIFEVVFHVYPEYPSFCSHIAVALRRVALSPWRAVRFDGFRLRNW